MALAYQKKATFWILIICFFTVLLSPQIAIGQTQQIDNLKAGLNTSASAAGFTEPQQKTNIPTMLGRVINYLFGALGIVFLIVILFGGLRWMTAGGSEEKVKQGKEFVVWGINGMIVIFLAYTFIYTVLQALNAATD